LLLKIKDIVQAGMDGIPVYMASGDSCDNIERINVAYLEAWETIDIGKKLYNNDFALTYSAIWRPITWLKTS
jgi:hypothetical protein